VTLAVDHRYRSPLLAVHDVACSAPHGACSGEEAASADEIAIVRRGVFRKRGPDGDHLIDPTRVAIFRRGRPYVVDHPGRGGDHCTVLTFAPVVLRRVFDAARSGSASPFSALPPAIPADRTLLLAFHRLLTALRWSPPDDLLIDDTAMLALSAFRDMAERYAARSVRRRQGRDRIGPAVRTLLAERYKERISIGGLASELAVSPFHLCRSFRSATGMTIHRYLTALRMTAALEMIGDYRGNLAQLALELGYSSHSHFATVFRSHFSISPSVAADGERFLALRKNLKAAPSALR
jgi:AraC-like DNA-binding protein